MGKTTDTYLHQKAKLILHKGKKVDKTPRGSKEKEVEIELHLNKPVIGNGQDKVYVFTDRTYKKRTYSL